MTKPHQDEPLFITEEVEAGLTAAGYEFEPPGHARTISLPEVLASLTDAELEAWPSTLSQEELEHRKAALIGTVEVHTSNLPSCAKFR